jgi:hypothetical protein
MDMASGLPPPAAISAFDKVAITIAGADIETARMSPRQDVASIRAVAAIMVCTAIYQAGLYSVTSHRLFAAPERFRIDLVAVSLFLAIFTMLNDSYMIMRSGWHLNGIRELKRGGLDISGGAAARIAAATFLGSRLLLAAGIAQLTAIMLSVLVFHADVEARIQPVYAQTNSPLVIRATALVDGGIERATTAVAVQGKRVTALAKQVTNLRENTIDHSGDALQQAQSELSQLLAEKGKVDADVEAHETAAANELGGMKGAQPGNGPKRKAALEQVENAKRHAADLAAALDRAQTRLETLQRQPLNTSEASTRSNDQLPTFEKALDTETSALAGLKDQLDTLIRNREAAIDEAVTHAPGYIRPDDGLLAQITVLDRLAHENSKIAIFILLIDCVAFAFELAAVLAKVTAFVPTTYSALLARDTYMRVVRIAEETIEELEGKQHDADLAPRDVRAAHKTDDAAADIASLFDPSSWEQDDAPPKPAKRPRGRPRKSPLN